MVFVLLSETAKQTEEMPEVLPLLLGFLVALGLLNFGLSMVRKKGRKENKKSQEETKEKDGKP